MTKNDYFRIFCKVSRTFGTTLDKDEILKLIVESVIDIMKGKAACLWLADEESNEFLPVAHKGLSKKYFQAPVHAEKIAAVVRKEGYLYALDADNGEQRWSFQTGGGIYSSPVVADATIYVGSDDGKLYAIE